MTAPASEAPVSFARRAFEVCGVAPLGVYTLVHVTSYARVLFSRDDLGGVPFGVPEFHGVQLVLEVLLVWLPWAFHAGFGLWLSAERLPAPGAERRALALLRLTAALSLAFVVGHVLWLRAPIWSGTRAVDDVPQMLAAGLSSTWQGLPLVAAGHLLGLGAVAAHLGLGVQRFFTRRELLSEIWATRVAWWLSVSLFVAGAASVLQLATGDFPPHFLY